MLLGCIRDPSVPLLRQLAHQIFEHTVSLACIAPLHVTFCEHVSWESEDILNVKEMNVKNKSVIGIHLHAVSS